MEVPRTHIIALQLRLERLHVKALLRDEQNKDIKDMIAELKVILKKG